MSLQPEVQTACCVSGDEPDHGNDDSPTVASPTCCSPQDTLCSDTESLLPKLPPVTPVPKLQLAALCLVRVVDPISFTQIFPYVNEMIEDLGVTKTPSQVGFYSGVVDSMFAIFQMCSIYHWAKLSDVIGRRPVILAGIVGVACATFMFGLSTTFLSIIIFRSLAGIFAGNIATIHAVLGEMTDATNQAVAFPIYGLCWPLGSVVGPLIGGTFSHPADHFKLFREIAVFRAYPYFLPCLISAIISLCGAVMGWCFLEETLPSKRRESIHDGHSVNRIEAVKAYGTGTRTVRFSDESESENCALKMPEAGSQPGMSALLAIPTLRALSASGFALSFLGGAYDVVFVLFCFSPISSGGLGFPAVRIGYALAIAGSTAALLNALVMPVVLRRVAPVTAYIFCMKLWPIAYLAIPLLNVIARMGLDDDNGVPDIERLKPAYTAAIWMGIAACLAVTRVSSMAFSLSMILVKEATPTPESLGATNGLVQFCMCMARAVAPAFVSALFAASVDNNILGSYFWVLVMVCLCLAGIKVTAEIGKQQKMPYSG